MEFVHYLKTLKRQKNRVSGHFRVLALFAFLGIICFSAQAQQTRLIGPSWWIGTAGGTNFNSFSGSITHPAEGYDLSEKTNGNGTGLFGYPVLEYHKPGANFGFMLHTGYESRRGKFDETFETKLAYVTFEPSLRMNLFKSPVFVYAGPRLGYNVDRRFYYWNITESNPNPSKEIDVFSDMNKLIVSSQIGLGCDIRVTGKNSKTQMIIAPFAAYHPSFGQSPRSAESWNVSTLRTGITFKFGLSRRVGISDHMVVPVVFRPAAQQENPEPQNVDSAKLPDFLYFNLKPNIGQGQMDNSLKIEEFDAVDSEAIPENEPTGKAPVAEARYFLNTLGRSMENKSGSTILLTGFSKLDQMDGRELAESLKLYLTRVFGINPERIVTEGQKVSGKRAVPAYSQGDIAILVNKNRWVSVQTNSLNLRTDAVLRSPSGPIQKLDVEEADPNNYLTIDTRGTDEVISFWSLKVIDEKGDSQNFGPFNKNMVRIPCSLLLKDQSEGRFQLLISGQSKSLRTITRDTTITLSHWTPPTEERSMRFSIIYRFNNTLEISRFEKYLTEVVVPAIIPGATVVIHGHSDVIHTDSYSLKISINRANDAKKIIEEASAKKGITDINFEVHGYGQDHSVYLFPNEAENQRQSKRTTIIDVINKP